MIWPLHVRTLLALLILSWATVLGTALATAAPAIPCELFATTAVQHIETDARAPDLYQGCDEGACRAGSGERCCMPAFGAQCCGFGAIHAGDGFPLMAIDLTLARWHLPSEEAIAGLDPQGDLRPPRHLG